jgi:hypothetical protein
MGDCYFLTGRKVIVFPSEMFGDILDPANRKDPVGKPRGMSGITTEDIMMELGRYVDCGTGIFFYDEDLYDVKRLKKRLHRAVENLDKKPVIGKRLASLAEHKKQEANHA